MAVPDPTQVAPWYLRNITQALALDSATGNVFMMCRNSLKLALLFISLAIGSNSDSGLAKLQVTGAIQQSSVTSSIKSPYTIELLM